MKVLSFPSCDFSLEDLKKMNEDELWVMANSNKWACDIYCSEKEFQDKFNDGYVSDESFIFFID